jgi:NAD(P)-dependent dehydrogenase (short-subunit alcohol dehydrogenase family)
LDLARAIGPFNEQDPLAEEQTFIEVVLRRRQRHMRKLEGKSALVTGQQGETLLVTAKHLINEGAHVFLMDSRCPELARTFHNVQRGLTCVRGEDVSDLRELDRLLAEIEREDGKLDIVFSNAVADEYPSISEILKDPSKSIDNLDITGACSVVQKALPLVRDGGSIILNTALVTGVTANSLYVAVKAMVFSVAQIWSRQLEDRWIRVNAIGSSTDHPPQRIGTALGAPEPSTSFSRSLPSVRPSTPSQVANAVISLLRDDSCDVGGAELVVEGDTARLRMLSTDPPLVRPASPDQIAQAAVYLASGDSKGITGMELFVDGGMVPL